ncbi:MAG: hypothetical protein VZR53_01570 [Prevotella sp.]|nr:hypothetical protein [Prevotella sp.]
MIKSTALFKRQKGPKRPSFTGISTSVHDFENKAVEDPIPTCEPIFHKNITS